MNTLTTPHRLWAGCKRILVVRPDNMGDLLMSTPAIRALKQTFQCEITVLTSSKGALIADSIPEIDDTIIYDVPWVKTGSIPDPDSIFEMVELLREESFDGAVIFTVYSQNPLPSALILYLAEIPLRLAYCRENPYGLLTQWEPEKEPYEYIRHQVRRDLDLVSSIGAYTADEQLHITVNEALWPSVMDKLISAGIDLEKPWVVIHPDVSEEKRMYPVAEWIAAIRKIYEQQHCQFLFTGLSAPLTSLEGLPVHSLVGQLNIEELVVLVSHARLIIAVNTGIIHIAAATNTPVVVLYALTNPQHTPWNVQSRVLYFDVPERLRSRNEVIRYAYHLSAQKMLPPATPESIALAATELLYSQQLSATS